MHQLAVAVADDLHLDVSRPSHELLEVHLVVSECRFRLAPRYRQHLGQLLLVLHDAHAAAAASPARLEHHGIADALRVLCTLLNIRG
jgi:hypothetical protein